MIDSDILGRCVAGSLALGLAVTGHRTAARGHRRFACAAHMAAAVAGLSVFFNLGSFHHTVDETFVNQWEHFHYQLGSKYFPELGYTGLYLASVAAETEVGQKKPVRLRNLETNRIEVVRDADLAAVRSRFDETRWDEFRSDNAYYASELSLGPRKLARAWQDHGYNPSPAWTFVARLFSTPLAASPGQLLLLAGIDLVVMACAFAAVFRSYGLSVGALCIAIFGTVYGVRYVFLGAFMRLDWLAAILIGLCLLKRGRSGWAGAALGYATAVRLFPAIFAFGALAAFAFAWLRGERAGPGLRLAGGFAVALAIAGLLGGATGRGLGAWTEFAENISRHQSTPAATRVGLDVLVLYGPEAASQLSSLEMPRVARPRPKDIVQRLQDRVPARVALALAMLSVLGLALWHATPVQGAVFGSVALFAATTSGGYYWILLCAAPLGVSPAGTLAALALGPLLYAIEFFFYVGEYPHMKHLWVSFGIGVLLLSWTLPGAARALREFRAWLRTRSVSD